MDNYEIYVVILCSIVFVLLTALSAACIYVITNLYIRLIRSGAEDDRILAEHRKKQSKKPNKAIKILDYAFSGIVCLALVLVFAGSFFIGCTDSQSSVGIQPFPSAYRVVRTSSMAQKNPKNTYLEENGINDHMQAFDLIRTEALPDETELELYDVVVYETDGMLIVHRIVEIEEPNEEHPDHRHFRLQGDAVDSPDRFPVLYEQMRAVYRGDRIPFVGSLILFMQSPAGWLCILLVVIAMVASPILENIIQKEKDKRLALRPAEERKVEPEPVPLKTNNHAPTGKLEEVTLGVIDKHFRPGEVVDIHSLKEKRLIRKDCKRIKIIETGSLSKSVTIYADGYSQKAKTKITRAGGTISKIPSSGQAQPTRQRGVGND